MIILICVLLMVSFVDICCYRIPNLWIGIGMAAGLLLTAIQGGASALLQSLLQVIIIFAAGWPFYLIKGLGAGDVKLFMVLGCYMRWEALVPCFFLSFLFAGAGVVIKLMFCRKSRERLLYFGRYCRKFILTGALDDYETDRDSRSVIRLSVPVLCSTLLLVRGGFV